MEESAHGAGIPTITEISDSMKSEEFDDLTELEFTPLPVEEGSDLEDRVYLIATMHGVRPI